MNKFPMLKFKAATLNQSAASIHGFLNPDKNEWDWSEMIYGEYPGLKDKFKDVKKIGDRKTVELSFFKEFVENNSIDLSATAEKFQAGWDKIGNEIFAALSKIVEEDWTKPTEIIAWVSLNPINPRDIKKYKFDLFYKYSPECAKSVSIHELFHFIYFKKWHQVFPETKDKEFDAPNFAWHLSEMVPQIVLNDKRLQKIFKHNFKSYVIYENAILDDKPLLSYLQKFYDKRKDFEDFLRSSWDFVQKNQEFIQSL